MSTPFTPLLQSSFTLHQRNLICMHFSVFLSNTTSTFSTHFSTVLDKERKCTGFVSYTLKATRFGQCSSPSNTAALVSPLTFSASFWFFNSHCRMQEGSLWPLLCVTPWTMMQFFQHRLPLQTWWSCTSCQGHKSGCPPSTGQTGRELLHGAVKTFWKHIFLVQACFKNKMSKCSHLHWLHQLRIHYPFSSILSVACLDGFLWNQWFAHHRRTLDPNPMQPWIHFVSMLGKDLLSSLDRLPLVVQYLEGLAPQKRS